MEGFLISFSDHVIRREDKEEGFSDMWLGKDILKSI
jgi:hypothetical protein